MKLSDLERLLAIVDRLAAKSEADVAEVEQLRVQLAGIFVAVEAGEPSQQHAVEGQYGWSPVYQRVRDAMRELRKEAGRWKPGTEKVK